MARDPIADLRRIKLDHQRCALAGRNESAPRAVINGCRMEPQHRPPRHAYLVARYQCGEQSAGREARPVDDETLAGVANGLELVKIRGDLTPQVAGDAYVRERRSRDGQSDSSR